MLALPLGRPGPPASGVSEIAQSDHEPERDEDQLQRLLLRHEQGSSTNAPTIASGSDVACGRGPQPARIGSGRDGGEAVLDRRDEEHET